MQISFENTFIDVWRFNSSHQIRNIPTQIVFILLSALFFYIAYSYEVDGSRQNSVLASLIVGIGSYIFLWLIQILFNGVFLYSRKNKSIFTKHTLEIQNDSLYEETPYNRSYFKWNGIEKILKISGYIAVYVTSHSAVLIPNKAFESNEQKEMFYNSLIEKVKNA